MPAKHKRKTSHGVRQLWLVLTTALLVLLALGLHSYFSLKAPDLPRPPLKELATAHGIGLGMHTLPDRLADQPYKQILTSQFSFITADGPLHWNKLRPSPTEYNFAPMDKLVSFAQAHHMPVQAYHLVWNEDDSLPEWLKNGHYSKPQLLKLMHDHISTVVGHYKGRVAAWTVVNEAFTRARHIYGLDDWWGDQLGGTDYIDKAFIWAHQADPQAKLILNDFYNETETVVSNDMYNYIKAVKARGVPIDGIGLQLHIDASRPPDPAAMIKNMRRFAALGVKVYITEFDISSASVNASPADKAQLEAHLAAEAVQTCIESKNCVSFTVFGMTDRENLLKRFVFTKSRSYLFTSRYQPKALFYSFRNAWVGP